MDTDLKTISKIIENAYAETKKILMDKYENLFFYISPTGYLTCWVRTPYGSDGAGINLKRKINVGCMNFDDQRYLEELNNEVEPVHNNPQEYFYCTECGKVKPYSEFEDNVFAGYYCKDCAKNPSVASLIEESHKRGFYD